MRNKHFGSLLDLKNEGFSSQGDLLLEDLEREDPVHDSNLRQKPELDDL